MIDERSGHIGLDGLATHFAQLYVRRNRVYHDNGQLLKMLCHILMEAEELQDGIRKNKGPEVLTPIFAKIVGWTFAVVNYFGNSFAGQTIAHWVSHKYPLKGCAYCGQPQCRCDPAARPPVDLNSLLVVEAEAALSLYSLQHALRRCYGAVNQTHGNEWIMGRLYAEITEAITHTMRMTVSDDRVDLIERGLALELCDVFAWACSMASMINLNVEQATLDHYAKCCPECFDMPCTCGHLADIREQQ